VHHFRHLCHDIVERSVIALLRCRQEPAPIRSKHQALLRCAGASFARGPSTRFVNPRELLVSLAHNPGSDADIATLSQRPPGTDGVKLLVACQCSAQKQAR
jgi:hypothetical protein